jgi:hypothetical protein
MKTVIPLDVLDEMCENKERVTSISVNTVAEWFLLYRINTLHTEPWCNLDF